MDSCFLSFTIIKHKIFWKQYNIYANSTIEAIMVNLQLNDGDLSVKCWVSNIWSIVFLFLENIREIGLYIITKSVL